MKTIVLFLLIISNLAFSQGPLAPPAAPAPSMKTLDQIESRIAIPKSPATPIAGPHFTISQSGSYYLTSNVVVSSGNGIDITISNVTLNLNGFALISRIVTPASGSAIDIGANLRNIEIKNGRISGGSNRVFQGPNIWDGAFANAGWSNDIRDVDVTPANGILISHLTVEQCRFNGINLAGSSVLDHVIANNNGFYGAYTGLSSINNSQFNRNGGVGLRTLGSVNNVTATENANYGIQAEKGSVNNAVASNNGNSGIFVGQGSVANSSSMNNGSYGIDASGGSVTNSRATSNLTFGIYVLAGVAVHCVGSGNSTDPANAHVNILTTGGQRIGCMPATE
jgi:hypothetical protein